MVLHTLNRSPAQTQLWRTCLRMALPGSGLLLLENAVFGALDTDHNRRLQEAASMGRRFVLEPDLAARGLTGRTLLPGFEKVDYAEFVALCLEYSKVQNWY